MICVVLPSHSITNFPRGGTRITATNCPGLPETEYFWVLGTISAKISKIQEEVDQSVTLVFTEGRTFFSSYTEDWSRFHILLLHSFLGGRYREGVGKSL